MTTTDYETILREARQLPLEARKRLSNELIDAEAEAPSGANLVTALRALEPVEPAAWDEMERLILSSGPGSRGVVRQYPANEQPGPAGSGALH